MHVLKILNYLCFAEKVASTLNLDQVMNIVCYMQEKWFMVGLKLKIPLAVLDDICKECYENEIPAESADAFCCIKMFKYWLNHGDNVSENTLLNVFETVNLKPKIFPIKTALESQKFVKDYSNPPDKLRQSYITMVAKVCGHLDKAEVDINDVLVYLKLSDIKLDVLSNVANFSDLISSLEKYDCLNKTDLSWLKYVVDYVKNLEAEETINNYETSLLADKIKWSSIKPSSGTYLVGKTSNQPETTTIKDNYQAKSAASNVVGIKNTDSILESTEVGSVIFYWKITNDLTFEIPKAVSILVKTECEQTGLTHIGKMINGSIELIKIDELENPEGNYVCFFNLSLVNYYRLANEIIGIRGVPKINTADIWPPICLFSPYR